MGAAIMRQQGMSMQRIVLMWGLIFAVTGVLAMFGSMAFGLSESQSSAVARNHVGSCIEGYAGGLMFAMIAIAMLPEALHGAGQVSGLCFVFGFVSISMVSAIGVRIG